VAIFEGTATLCWAYHGATSNNTCLSSKTTS